MGLLALFLHFGPRVPPAQVPDRFPLDAAALIDGLPAGVFVCESATGQLVQYNRRAAELWGREPTLGNDGDRFDGAFRLFSPDGKPLSHHQTPMAAVLETGRTVRGVDLLVERPDGSRLTVAMTVSPLRDAHDNLCGGVAVFHEVSERRRAEERERVLLQASALLGSTLDHQVILRQLARLTLNRYADWCLIEVVEDDGQIRGVAGAHVRSELEPLVGELAGRPGALGPEAAGVLQSGNPYLLSAVPPAFAEQAATGPRHRDLLRTLAPESLMVVPLQARGRVFGLIAFVLSGSNRRYDPADIPLAEGIARRAALAIDNARLFRASEQANRLKDEFLATLSHELRTPLNAVLGWTQLLLTRQLNPGETRHALEIIRRNAEVQANLIGDILDVSKIITGKLRLNVRPVNLANVVRAAVDSVRPAAEARRLALIVDISGPVQMRGDPDRLQQVVWNLLSNAVKFTPPGGEVGVTVGGNDRTGVLTVRDTGVGIPTRFVPSLFERFRQADSSTTRRHGGLGLGLAIVRHLVELHGGMVQGDSAGEGRGATFTVTLPIQQDTKPEIELQRTRTSTAVPVGPGPALDGLHVLVVDDDADSRELLRTVLSGLGAVVAEAASVEGAMGALRRHWPDVMLTDIGMPGHDGYELIGRVRQLEREEGKRLPVVAITAYARDHDRARVLEAGFDSYLAKPVEPPTVARLVGELGGRADASG